MSNLAAYRPYWQAIAISEEVTDRPRRFTLLDEHLVAYRTSHGPVVMKDLCIHRGSALSLGRLIDDRIECAYHGWQYDHTGACVRIPALPVGKPIPAKARAICYPVREEAGLLWVALDDPIGPFPEWPLGCAYSDPVLRGHVMRRYSWDVGAGRAVENYLDLAHLPFVHDGTLGNRDAPLVEEHAIERDEHGMSYRYWLDSAGGPHGRSSVKDEMKYFYHVPFVAHLKRTNQQGEWTCISLIASPTSATTSELFVTCVRNYNLDPAYDEELTEFVDFAMKQDKAVVSSVRPEEIPVDLREELHIKVPDAAGMYLRRFLGKIEGNSSVA